MFISLDLETTGVDPKKDKIIEFGAVKFDETGEVERLSFLINPGIKLPDIITHITNIIDKDLEDAPPITQKVFEIQNFIGNYPIIGHNIQFDTSFLRANGITVTNPEYDTFEMAGILLPGLTSYSLEILSHELDLQHREKHRALDDAIAAMELFTKLSKKFQQLPKDVFDQIQELLKKSDWPLANYFFQLKNTPKSLESSINKSEEKQKTELSPFAKEVLEKQSSLLAETAPPYQDLAQQLTENAQKDSYIAVDSQTFLNLSNKLPGEIAKIDAAKNYLSPKRLQEMLNKKSLLPHELTALIKLIIWQKQTKTGLLRELNLFRKEKSIAERVNVDEDLTDPNQEPFIQKALEKDQKSSAICSYNYIFELEHTIKELIIIDLERFLKQLFYYHSKFLNLEIISSPLLQLKELFPENTTIESLLAKIEILIGLIGLFYEKYNDRNPYAQRTTINEQLINTEGWQKINQSINNLIEISRGLGEINNEHSSPYLKKWKEVLTDLKDIFSGGNLDLDLITIEKDYRGEQIFIRKNPTKISEFFKEILEKCETLKIIDESLQLDDSCDFIKHLLDLPPDIELIKDKKENNLEIFLLNDEDEVVKPLIDTFKQNPGKTAMVFNSKQQMEFFTLRLSKAFQDSEIEIISQTTGTDRKVAEKFKQNPDKSILLITKATWENFLYPELIDTLIIQKIPFEAPSNLFLIALSKTFSDSFNDFQLPRAAFAMKKLLNRLSNKDSKAIFLDTRTHKKSYSKIFQKTLEKVAETTIISSEQLPEIVKKFHH